MGVLRPVGTLTDLGKYCGTLHVNPDIGVAPVSSTRKLISSSFHRLDMTLAVAEALNPNNPNQTTASEVSHQYWVPMETSVLDVQAQE